MASEVQQAATPASSASGAVVRLTPRRSRIMGRMLRGMGWALALTLLALNSWWFWRDFRPVADLKTVARWIKQGNTNEAEWTLREQIRRSPHDGEALMLLARILAQRNDNLNCARTLHKIPFWYPDKGKMLFLEAQAFKSLDRRSEAEIAWKALTAMDPLHPLPDEYVNKAVLDLMEIYALEERWDEAHALLWKAYDHAESSERPRYLIMRMRTELERVQPARAVTTLRRFVEAVPEDWEARRALAHAETASSHVAEATRLIRQCISEKPDDRRGWRELLTILHDQGDDAGLSETLARVPKLTANDPEIMKFQAAILERNGDWAGAVALYRRMIEAQPSNAEYLYRLATAEERTGLRKEVREHRNRSMTIRAARADLGQAFQAYLDLTRASQPDPRALANAVAKVSSLCEALGWTREAKAWLLLAPTD